MVSHLAPRGMKSFPRAAGRGSQLHLCPGLDQRRVQGAVIAQTTRSEKLARSAESSVTRTVVSTALGSANSAAPLRTVHPAKTWLDAGVARIGMAIPLVARRALLGDTAPPAPAEDPAAAASLYREALALPLDPRLTLAAALNLAALLLRTGLGTMFIAHALLKYFVF
jgi:hypothetical protein